MKFDHSPNVVHHVCRILDCRVGKDNAIKMRDILDLLAKLGYPQTDDRIIRDIIKHQRRNGKLYCVLAAGNGGHYTASSRAEFDEFLYREYIGKIADMQETVSAMKRTARATFGDGVQLGLGV